MDRGELAQLKEFLETSNNSSEKISFYKKYPLGFIWESNIKSTLTRVIENTDSAEDKLFQIQDTVLYSIDANNEKDKELTFNCWNEYFKKDKNIVLSELADNIQESEFYNKDKIFQCNNRRYSLDFFKKLNIAFNVREIAPNPSLRVLEVGAGFGQVGRILKLIAPSMQYVIIDIPETLYLAYLFLRLNFPAKKILWVYSREILKSNLQTIQCGEIEFVLIPCCFADYLVELGLEYDVAVNTSSFGEMKNESSGYYIDLIQKRLNIKNIVFLNRFLNPFDPDIEMYRLDENGWYMNLDEGWSLIKWEIEPEFTRFPYNEVLHNRELFVVAKRDIPKANYQDNLDDIYQQKWYKNFILYPHERYADFLRVDLDMGSVIQRLIHAVKKKITEKNCDALIKYIYLLEGKYAYEERFYFTKKYRELTGRKHFIDGNPRGGTRFIKSILKSIGLLNIVLLILNKFPIARLFKKILFKEKKSAWQEHYGK